MRWICAAAMLILIQACGQTATEEGPPASPVAADASADPAPASETPASPAPATSFDNADQYDAYPPPTPAADAEYNRRASEPGIRICSELWAAATSDDVNGIQNILRSGVSIDCVDANQNGQTGLIAAASGASADAARYLIDHGANVNLRDASGMTALAHAEFRRQQFATQMPDMVTRFDAIIAALRARGAQ